MSNAVFKEDLVGKYHGVVPPTLMEPGAISDGKNVRKVSDLGGWKTRKGCAMHNTTALESGAEIKSVHSYRNPLQGDRNFIVQANSKLLKATNVPPASGTTFGSQIGPAVGTTKGFSDQVGEWWFYADGSGRPVAYGGTGPFPRAVVNYDASENEYADMTRKVKDNRSDTYGILLGAATDKLYVISQEPISSIVVNLGSTVNSEAATLTVKTLRSGTLTSVTGLSDGTESGGSTLAQDGTISWTLSTTDTVGLRGGYSGYVTELGWSAALTSSIRIISLNVVQPAAFMTNKWHGVYEYVSGCRHFDNDSGEYVEVLGKISSESTSTYVDLSEAGTSDFLYIKTPEPACAFGLAPAIGYENSADAQIDLIECLEGDTWTDISTFSDTTLDSAGDSSFAQLGIVSFDTSTLSPTLRTNAGDSYPGYWYRISWDAALSDDTRIYMVVYATAPETLPAYDGCLEFKGRLILWGDPEFPNKLRFSQFDKPFCFTGTDAGYSEALGYADPILCAKRFYSELVIWKKSSIWLIEGYNMATFGALRLTSVLGIASPKTAHVIETGYPSMHTDEPLMIAIWQAVDGVYVLDGRKPRKISGPVDQYFNQEYSICISSDDITSLDAFVDYSNNEYHLLLPSGVELVYNYLKDEWFPPWSRKVPLTCGMFLRGWDASSAIEERYYTYGGSASGFVFRLETDTSDKTVANADEAIENYIKTRAIAVEQEKGLTLKFVLRRIYVETKAQTAGSLTTTLYLNRDTTGVTAATPTALSMVNSGSSIAFPRLDFSRTQILCFELKFLLSTIDQEFELYSFVYEVEGQGLPGI